MDIASKIFLDIILSKYSRALNQSWRSTSGECNGLSIKDLNKIVRTLNTTHGNNLEEEMRFAGQLLALSTVYYRHYRGLYKDEGTERGRELHERAYDLLYAGLGPRHSSTLSVLRTLCRWDLPHNRRRKLLSHSIAFVTKYFRENEGHSLIFQALLDCCLRNEDYGEDVKILRALLIKRCEDSSYDHWRYQRMMLNIYMGEHNWKAAEKFASTLVAKWEKGYTIFSSEGFEILTILGRAQIMQERAAEGEATLMRIAPNEKRLDSGEECCEELVELYMKQGRWEEVEKWLGHLIYTKESSIKNIAWYVRGHLIPAAAWVKAIEMVPRIDEMSIWRARESDENMATYCLFGIYKNKYHLALAYIHQKRHAEAQELLDAMVKANAHPGNPTLTASKKALVDLCIELGLLDEAERVQESLVLDIDKIFGADYENLRIVPALQRLSDIYRRNNHWCKRHDVQARLLRYR
ncbi:hypothetical protein CPB83DRAFT_864563 [Crepidotus variabilis]|uniref:Uncharacterized protein n=1 Tax=Crepidotus variabilis TaxID=179855 RepID=A0A9P6JIK7_9AGAR|nr:hypothetical protein CPB83DRAFT_864563 [Crepidotus variabilis]